MPVPTRTLWDNGVLLGAGAAAPVKSVVAMTDDQILIGHTNRPPTPGSVSDLPIIAALQKIGRGTRVRNSANQNIAGLGTVVALTFDTEDFDDDNLHNPGVNPTRITFAETGRYLMGAGVQWDGTLTGDRQIFLGLSSGVAIASAYQPAGALAGGHQIVQTVFNVTAGQYLEAFALQTTAGTIQTVAAASYTPVLWVIRVA
jgi:hypothetical protein